MSIIPLNKDDKGFTLIEIIAVILVAAVLGALFFNFFGDIFIKSGDPINRLKQTLRLQQVMENIIEDYESSDKSEIFLEGTLKNNIGNEGTDQDNAYGRYHVVDNRFIKFINGSETSSSGPDPKETLKIQIGNGTDETLTALFTSR